MGRTVSAKLLAVSIALSVGGTALAQERAAENGPYVGGGILIGVSDLGNDEDSGTGGIGGFGRLGYQANRFLGVEAELGVAGGDGPDTLVHGAALGTLKLPLGPIDVRARGGLAIFNDDDDTNVTPAIGGGLGVRFGGNQSIRADLLVGDSFDDSGDDLLVSLQLGYQWRF